MKMPLLNSRVCQRPQEFSHGLHANVPFLPLLALKCRTLASVLDYEINAAIEVRASAPGHRVTELPIQQANHFLELEPIDLFKPLQKFCHPHLLGGGGSNINPQVS